MEQADFIMAGGGLAGLSLAYRLCSRTKTRPDILILDSDRPGSGDRTWSYWSVGAIPFSELAAYEWDRVRFTSGDFDDVLDLAPFTYSMIRGEDFFAHVLDFLESQPNVEMRTESVEAIDSDDDRATVTTSGGRYAADWVFDSRFDPEAYVKTQSSDYHYLMQHFLGWVIETEQACFDPRVPTLFDFTIDQHDEMRFMYVLPFSENKALVEFTLFSATLLEDSEYARELEAYVDRIVHGIPFRVVDRERGVIPMTDQPFLRQAGPRVVNIGTRAGMVKASTGYAFRRIQEDLSAIISSLERNGHPFELGRHKRGFGTLDTMLLQIMYRRGELSKRVFTALFSKNPVPLIFRFLDEETSIFETMRIMASCPWMPFIHAWFRTKVLGRI